MSVEYLSKRLKRASEELSIRGCLKKNNSKDKSWVQMRRVGEKKIYAGELNIAGLKMCLGVTY